jgi:hypothetical protein
MQPEDQRSKAVSVLALCVLLVALVGAVIAPAASMAAQPSRHYGPFDSSSLDSGTCGNDWANDTYKRHFDAATTPSTDGTYTVTENFISGRFVTLAGSSPDACDPSGTLGSTIVAGVTGNFKGNFTVIVIGGVYNPAATCTPSTCDTTDGFVKTVYGEAATSAVSSFGFTYHANGPALIQREWDNASADRGGNSGDIRSS